MIRFENVDFRFGSGNGGPWIIEGFNLAIPKGELHLLLGPSGCGKTTALNLLAGFETATRGRVAVSKAAM